MQGNVSICRWQVLGAERFRTKQALHIPCLYRADCVVPLMPVGGVHPGPRMLRKFPALTLKPRRVTVLVDGATPG